MPTKIYLNAETAVTWTDSGGDEILDLGSLAADAGRVGERRDLGSGARSKWYEWILKIDGFDTAPVEGETVDLYMAQSDGTLHDGPVASNDGSDAALSDTDLLDNLTFLGSAVVHSTTAADDLVARGVVKITSRFFIPVVHNNTADALLGTSDAHSLTLTPVPDEIQD